MTFSPLTGKASWMNALDVLPQQNKMMMMIMIEKNTVMVVKLSHHQSALIQSYSRGRC